MPLIEKIATTIETRPSTLSGHFFRIADIRRNGALGTSANPSEALQKRQLIEQLRDEKAIALVSEALGERAYAKDAQVHRMLPGADLPAHTHSNEMFVIFHFSKTFDGGQYFEIRSNERVYPPISPYSLVINRDNIEHGVEAVSAGIRTVLVTVWKASEFKR